MSKKQKAQGGYSRVKFGILIATQDFCACEVRMMRDLVAEASRDWALRAVHSYNKKEAFSRFRAAFDSMQTANRLDEALNDLEDLEAAPRGK